LGFYQERKKEKKGLRKEEQRIAIKESLVRLRELKRTTRDSNLIKV
jgi:hypothetical protein